MTTFDFISKIKDCSFPFLVYEHRRCSERLDEKTPRMGAYLIEKEILRRAYLAEGLEPRVSPRVHYEPDHQTSGSGNDQASEYRTNGDYSAALPGPFPIIGLVATAIALLGTGIVLGTIFGLIVAFSH